MAETPQMSVTNCENMFEICIVSVPSASPLSLMVSPWKNGDVLQQTVSLPEGSPSRAYAPANPAKLVGVLTF